ncbi:glycosyltransferase [Pseudomonas nicosulfuronedens]|uniref:Glycosyltransferase n=1 Tax=Pseudomonas nicosulfuronedens TaxID=2571105 RepID=A0A5R9RIQ6_9PSED|nr:glycosyltransferase [Pseudomonas nicosulfuronedens]MDH1008884.1 glycosyltransferase [Pseudomonas nicosulfuronedens]MDH1981499.1 glycosyltransferase [Pseudomonas nicosulfuronedens]MDH2029619.1 glycosyltransferase [Pseudomonas nicosulfuronedens]TLX75143.1 glycosyltransferase [Pseudomonas nicosulfuronedens]
MNGSTVLVTLTYGDRLEYLEELLARAFREKDITRAIVVSNASVAELDQLFMLWPNRVQVIELDSNTGSANGYAVGIEAALKTGCDFIWLMDDDNAPTPGSFPLLKQRLIDCALRHGADNTAVLGFRPTHQADVASGVPTRFITPPRSSYFGFHVRQLPYKLWRRTPWGKPKPRRAQPLLELPFAYYGGLLGHADLFRRIGLPRRDLVLYADDTEYTFRIGALGGHLYLVPEAGLDDLEHSWNIKERTSNIYETYLLGSSDLRAYYAARNQAWFDKNLWVTSPLMYRFNRWVFIRLLHFFARRHQRESRLALLLQAIRDGEAGALGMNRAYPL